MKSTGIVRKIDGLGRFVLPIELRRSFEINPTEDTMEIFIENDKIILRKYAPECLICGEIKDDMICFRDKKICYDCIDNLYHDIHKR